MNKNEIELEMFLLLKQAEWKPREGYFESYKEYDGTPVYLYMHKTQTKDIKIEVVTEEYTTDFMLQYDEKYKTYRPNIKKIHDEGELDDFSLWKCVKNFLEEHNMLDKPGKGENLEILPIEFSEEEKDFFGNPEDVFNNLIATEPLGAGGFRFVYDLGDFVLKIANDKYSPYVARKVNESEANQQMYLEFQDILVKTYKHAPDYTWIIQDKVEPITSQDQFSQLVGQEDDWSRFKIAQIINKIMGHRKYIKNLQKEFRETGKRSYLDSALEEEKEFPKFFIRLAELVKKYGTSTKDLKRSNFGVTKQGKLVLLDVGTHDRFGL